ncbi:MAG TPA: DNA primase, partial [Verrucomicrobiales bacterium]|nr:DNA primase [Verrucomicrobiales bacterium]
MPGFFGAEFIEQVRAASDIVEVVGGYFPLKRAGASFTALCPFHREKSPSFHVSPGRQAFHCFGCHKGGDVFRFVQDYESVTFVEAVQRLAQRANIPLRYEDGRGPDPTQHVKETLREMHEQIATRWQSALSGEAQGEIARQYLARRGVTEEAVRLFRIGYAPDAWDDTVNWCKSKGYDLEVAAQAGLVVKKEETGRFYDRFRGRLMFPICDEQGRVIAFSGRILQGDEKTAKYVNSPETPIFTKGKVFYGLDKTKRSILDAGFAIICEGQLDLIACHTAGVRNIVAPQGTAFTSDHARILRRYVEEVVLCFDSDNAGQNAAVRVLDSLLGAGLAIRVAVVPAPHDPDSFIKEQGGEAFARLVREAPGFFDFHLDRLCRQNDVNSDRGRLAVLREMGSAVNKTGNSVLVDKYVQKTAVRLGVSSEAVRQEFRKLKPAPAGRDSEEVLAPGGEEPAVTARPTQQELWLLRILMTSEDILPLAAEHLDLSWVSHGLVRHLLQLRLTPLDETRYPSVATLMGSLPDEDSRRLVSESAVDPRPLPNPAKTLLDLLTTLR